MSTPGRCAGRGTSGDPPPASPAATAGYPRPEHSLHRPLLAAGLCALLAIAGPAAATTVEDAYLEGFASGVMNAVLGAGFPKVSASNGVLTVPLGDLEPAYQKRVMTLLARLPGVSAVETSAAPAVPDPTGPSTKAGLRSGYADNIEPFETGALPAGLLFRSLLADPRWAHFSATARHYADAGIDGDNNAAVSFGETLPFYRDRLGASAIQWETGLQAGVFSEFNLDAPSSDLINSDFIASLYASFRRNASSAFLRLYHQSSHLGDEFLLQTRLERINVSYEGVDLRLSREFANGLRLYAGGGGIFHREPEAIRTWSTQYGLEYRSPWRFELLSLRPIVGIDVRNHEQNGWSTDVTARAGWQVDNVVTNGRTLQFLLEYASGHSPAGQFYKEKVDYIGFGAHYNH